MNAYRYYSVELDENNLKVYSANGNLILSSEQIIAEYDSVSDTFTATATKSGSNVVIAYTGSKAVFRVTFQFSNTPVVNVSIDVEYLNDVLVDNERLRFLFVPSLSEIYYKNRTKITNFTATEYWIDRQGCKFGSGDSSAMIYHTPNIASMFVNSANNTLDVVIDSHDSHWFVHTHEGDSTTAEADDLGDAIRAIGDTASYTFAFIFGYDAPIKPRIMLNPNGYEAGFVWTEHPDNSIMETQRASMFGDSNITTAENATGGFAYHDLPITKAVFYYGNPRQIGVKTQKGGSINTDFTAYLDEVEGTGCEICLHTPSGETDTREESLEAIAWAKAEHDTITWIDHGAIINREAISSDGLVTDAENYIADYWDTYGTKYFWQYGSETGEHNGIDKLAIGKATNLVTPLYWRHPTRMRDYISWCARTIGSRAYETFLTSANINSLVNNWGFSIIHTYSVSSADEATFCTKNEDGSYSISEYAEARLAEIASLRDSGDLNVCTLRSIIDYWKDIEKVSIEYQTNGNVTIINNSGHTISGFSVLIDTTVDYTFKIATKTKDTANGKVIWFDLPTSGAEIVLNASNANGKQIFHNGELFKMYSGQNEVVIAE